MQQARLQKSTNQHFSPIHTLIKSKFKMCHSEETEKIDPNSQHTGTDLETWGLAMETGWLKLHSISINC